MLTIPPASEDNCARQGEEKKMRNRLFPKPYTMVYPVHKTIDWHVIVEPPRV